MRGRRDFPCRAGVKESTYYQHSKYVPLASRFSLHVRRQIFHRFMTAFAPGAATSILDVGVTSDSLQRESNYFEQFYPYPGRITAVGTEDGSHLAEQYRGLRYQRVEPGNPLPFSTNQFDIVFSNAVLEHTGCRSSQAAFLKEMCRVGRRFFVTTPNRWFPIEHHTGLPFLHFLPCAAYRAILAKTSYRHWADEGNLNILSGEALRRMLPAGVKGQVETVRLFGLPSNLVAFGDSHGVGMPPRDPDSSESALEDCENPR
jgi:SAM-dependent methyltransferase